MWKGMFGRPSDRAKSYKSMFVMKYKQILAWKDFSMEKNKGGDCRFVSLRE